MFNNAADNNDNRKNTRGIYRLNKWREWSGIWWKGLFVKTAVSVVERNLSFTMDLPFDPSYNDKNSSVYKNVFNAVSLNLPSASVT